MTQTTTLTISVVRPPFFWLRAILPEYLRAFWAYWLGREPDLDAAGKRISAKLRFATQ